MSRTANKGEWSEIYTFLKLLVEKKLFSNDIGIYYPLIAILRNELSGSYKYNLNGNIKVVNGVTNETIIEVETSEISNLLDVCFSTILNSKSTFPIPEIEPILEKLYVTKIKSDSNEKRDITIVVHDPKTGFNPELGYSIKSKVGGDSTLFNSNLSSNFIYEIIGDLDDNTLNTINAISTKSKIRDRVKAILVRDYSIKFSGIASDIFRQNLETIDSLYPQILAQYVLEYYCGKGNKINVLTDVVREINPSNIDNISNVFYSYKIKNFLTDSALGMTAAKKWDGVYDATGGFIFVEEDGNLTSFHIYNRSDFQDYLYNNCRLDTPDPKRLKFGEIYKEDNKYYMKLNLQIRL